MINVKDYFFVEMRSNGKRFYLFALKNYINQRNHLVVGNNNKIVIDVEDVCSLLIPEFIHPFICAF